jgi:UDP-N-acetylmuramate: L-alanyl-gamma-D-glutamyl-meso-diaminopimelate ligase
MPAISEDEIKAHFNHPNLTIFTEKTAMVEYLQTKRWRGLNLLMMSSGTFNGLDFNELENSMLG